MPRSPAVSAHPACPLLIAIKMYLPFDHWRIRAQVPLGLGGNLISGFIALVSAMLGIGGGMLGVPAMTLLGEPVHRAVGTAAMFGLLIGARSGELAGRFRSGEDLGKVHVENA